MATIIGLDTLGGSNINTIDGRVYIHNKTAEHFTPTTINQEVYEFGIYTNNTGNSGVPFEIGIYDVTSGVDGATLVGTAFSGTGDSTVSGFQIITLVSPITLTSGTTYAVGFVSIGDVWSTGGVGGYLPNSELRQESQTSLPSPFISAGSYASLLPWYAVARSAAYAKGDIPLTLTVNGNVNVGTVAVAGGFFPAMRAEMGHI